MYLVTGATGNVGRHVVRELESRGAPVRAFVRDAARAREALGEEVETAVGDFADAESIRRACAGAEAVLLSCPNSPRQVEYEANVIDAAVEAGVPRLVKISTIGADDGRFSFFDWHARSERHARAAGIPAVILRSSFLQSNLLAASGSVAAEGRLYAPAREARIAMIDPRDVAAAAVVALTEDGHESWTYVLTGPEALTYAGVADELSRATGRPIEFVDVPEAAAREGLLAEGQPGWFVDGLLGVFARLREGVAEVTTDTVRELTGREPRPLAEFLREHASLFGRAPAAAGKR